MILGSGFWASTVRVFLDLDEPEARINEALHKNIFFGIDHGERGNSSQQPPGYE
jgi:hypothetical protein